MLSDSNARLAAARGLTKSRGRRQAGRFLAEGAQAVREALAAGVVVELFVTERAWDAEREIVDSSTVAVDVVSDKAAAALSETVSPQGLVAVCSDVLVSLTDVLSSRPSLIAVLVEVNEPGNLGAIIRTADAAGADAVILAGDSVDPYNGKCVRATAGSLFHLPIAVVPSVDEVVDGCRAAGLQVLATTGSAEADLDELAESGSLAAPTAWVFGNEARGLEPEVIAAADARVRIPIHGRAESLNLAAAAAVCLYASAGARRARPE